MDAAQETANKFQVHITELNEIIINRTQRINEKTQQINSTTDPFAKKRYGKILKQLTEDRTRYENQRKVCERCGDTIREMRQLISQLQMAPQTVNANQISQVINDANEAMMNYRNLCSRDEINRILNEANEVVNAFYAPIEISDEEVAAAVNAALGLPQPNGSP